MNKLCVACGSWRRPRRSRPALGLGHPRDGRRDARFVVGSSCNSLAERSAVSLYCRSNRPGGVLKLQLVHDEKIHSWILNALCKHGLCRSGLWPRASCAQLLSPRQETRNTETKERGRPLLSKVTAGESRRAPRTYITSVSERLYRPPG